MTCCRPTLDATSFGGERKGLVEEVHHCLGDIQIMLFHQIRWRNGLDGDKVKGYTTSQNETEDAKEAKDKS